MEKADFSTFTEFRLGLSEDWATLVIRRRKKQAGEEEEGEELEVDWQVGPIPTKHKIGKDAVVLYNSLGSIRSQEEFFTDSNGRQFLRRIRNQRWI